jgi:putative ABC transport system permease protein
MLFFLQGFIGGMTRSVIKNSTKNESGHIRITTHGFLDKKRFMPVDENILEPEKLIGLITNDQKIGKEIDLVSERFYFGLLLQHQGNNKSAIAIGGDPDQEKKLLMLNKSIVSGNYFQEKSAGASTKSPGGKKIHEIIMGKKMADTLRLKIGDTTTVLVQGSDYALHVPTLKLVGIFQTGLNEMDDLVFQMPLKDAKDIMHCGDSAQQIMIMLKNYQDSDRVAGLITAKLKGNKEYHNLAVIPWTKAGGYAETLQDLMSMYALIYLVIAFLGAFIITNIMMMVVLERRKEIGIIKSMGFSRMEVLLLFLLEGTALGTVGSMSGIVLGILASLYFIFHGIDFSSSIGQMNMPIDNVIKITLSVPGVIGIMFLGIVVASVVAVIPSRQAAKMNAVDAIKSV